MRILGFSRGALMSVLLPQCFGRLQRGSRRRSAPRARCRKPRRSQRTPKRGKSWMLRRKRRARSMGMLPTFMLVLFMSFPIRPATKLVRLKSAYSTGYECVDKIGDIWITPISPFTLPSLNMHMAAQPRSVPLARIQTLHGAVPLTLRLVTWLSQTLRAASSTQTPKAIRRFTQFKVMIMASRFARMTTRETYLQLHLIPTSLSCPRVPAK